jgi:UDP-N-acetylmuramoyl-tripeptide--D-alanyl-D-alanine ligase
LDLTLTDVAKILNVDLKKNNLVPIDGFSTDSRTLREGMLFFALNGEHFDGHRFIDDVFRKKACGAVVSHEWYKKHGQNTGEILLPVNDPLTALQDVATHIRRSFKIPVVAITGTNGKTSTKEMIASVLETKYVVMKSQGNLNNHIGLPLSIGDWNREGEIAIVEMGTNHFGEIKRLCEIAQPTHGVITNIGKGHLEFFGDLEGVARAKGELLEYLRLSGVAFLNGDDPCLLSRKGIVKKTIMFGFSDGCDIRGEELGIDSNGFPEMKLGGRIVKISVPGWCNLYNGLAAAAVGRSFGVSWEDICDTLGRFRTMDRRMEVINLSGVIIINDAYNANPSSVKQSLVTLRQMNNTGRKILVLGDMLELGEGSEPEHRNVGGEAVLMGIDALFCYGPMMKVAVESAYKSGLGKAKHFNTKIALSDELNHYVRQGDIVLVKGSRGMRMEDVVDALKEGLGRINGGD